MGRLPTLQGKIDHFFSISGEITQIEHFHIIFSASLKGTKLKQMIQKVAISCLKYSINM